MKCSYKFRIYPNIEQQELIQKTFGCCRYVYNYFLDQRIKSYQTEKKGVKYFDQSKSLTALRRELDWLCEPEYNALQNSLRDLDAAYKNFFRRVENKKNPGFPKFKSKKNNRRSYRTNGKICLIEKYIK